MANYDPEELLQEAIEIVGGRMGHGGRGNAPTMAYISFGKTHARLVVPSNICFQLGWSPGQSKISILHLPNNHWVACQTRTGNLLSSGGKGSPTVQFSNVFPVSDLREISCEVDSNILVFSKPLRTLS